MTNIMRSTFAASEEVIDPQTRETEENGKKMNSVKFEGGVRLGGQAHHLPLPENDSNDMKAILSSLSTLSTEDGEQQSKRIYKLKTPPLRIFLQKMFSRLLKKNPSFTESLHGNVYNNINHSVNVMQDVVKIRIVCSRSVVMKTRRAMEYSMVMVKSLY